MFIVIPMGELRSMCFLRGESLAIGHDEIYLIQEE